VRNKTWGKICPTVVAAADNNNHPIIIIIIICYINIVYIYIYVVTKYTTNDFLRYDIVFYVRLDLYRECNTSSSSRRYIIVIIIIVMYVTRSLENRDGGMEI